MTPETLPQWWGPDGFSCRTTRIDLRAGGEWVFDMIAPDGTVFPNHHRYGEVRDGATKVTPGMVFSTDSEFREAKGFGAVEPGLQTPGKLERFVLAR